MKLKPCKYCDEHAIEISRCPNTNPMEPVRILCTKCNFQVYGATEEEAIERWNKEYDLVHKPKGVMIKGMEMPKNCCECFCCDVRIGLNNEDKWEVYFARCKVKIKNATRTKRPSWCPLQEVK